MKVLQRDRRTPGLSWGKMLLWTYSARFCQRVFQVWCWAIYQGDEHIPAHGPVIFIGNHQSHLDPVIIGSHVHDRSPSYLARATLFKFPPLGWLMSTFGAQPLDQSKGDIAAFRWAMNELKAGRTIIMFPEGTRSPDGSLREFKSGVELLLRRSKAQLVPVAIEGASYTWPRGWSRPRLYGRLASRVGPGYSAEEIAERGADVVLQDARRRIEEMRLELRALLRRRTGGRIPAPGPADVPFWIREAGDA